MADTPMRLDAPKERRGSIPSMFGDPSQRRRGNVLSSADMLGVRRKNSAEGSSSSKGSAPALLLRASTGPLPGRGKDGTFSVAAVAVAAAAAAAAAAAVPESNSFKAQFKSEAPPALTPPALGAERSDPFKSEAGGTAVGTAGGTAGGMAGASTQAPPALERRPSKEALSFGASDQSFTGFSEEDLNTVVDLRVFMDPAPHTISELAPMASVYHMFNQVS